MNSTDPSEAELRIGRYVRNQFGNNTSVVRYGDDTREFSVFLVSGRDWPVEGVTSYCTTGVALHPVQAGNQQVSIEILGACASAVQGFDRVISSCSFERIKNGTQLALGSVVPDLISQYELSPSMKHVLLVRPFLWPRFEKATTLGDRTVHWLQAVPISDNELAYHSQFGFDALEGIFVGKQIDVFDIARASTV